MFYPFYRGKMIESQQEYVHVLMFKILKLQSVLRTHFTRRTKKRKETSNG